MVLSKADSLEAVEPHPKPLLVKIAPDLSECEIEMIVDTCLRLKVSGIIATNTTISREGLKTADADTMGAGGLSGKPLSGRSNQVIRTIYRHSKGNLPIIGVGGVFSGQDAFNKIAAGASLIQSYTGFIYHGPSFARDLKAQLAELMTARGLNSLDELVGSGTRP
jgi:dihydroorotate dehydrogenase